LSRDQNRRAILQKLKGKKEEAEASKAVPEEDRGQINQEILLQAIDPMIMNGMKKKFDL